MCGHDSILPDHLRTKPPPLVGALFMVEVGRIELPSESILTGTSPGAGGHLHSLVPAQAAMLGDLVAS